MQKVREFGTLGKLFGLALVLCSVRGVSVQIVTESPNPACEELRLVKELKMYKDPALFSGINADAATDVFRTDSPLLTTLKGTIQLMRLGPPRPFRNFGPIAKVYELAEPTLRAKPEKEGPRLTRSLAPEDVSPEIIPIKVCGDNAYTDTLGFVLVSDLRDALTEEYEAGTLPPSTYPNPIPVLKGSKTGKN